VYKRIHPLVLLMGGVGLVVALLVAVVPTTAQGTAQVRVIHGSPDAPSVDVYVDGMRAFTLAFPNASPYVAIPAGARNFRVFAAGANPATDRPVIDQTAPVPAGVKLSIVASGRLATLRPLIVDDTTAAPASGQAKVRFVHNSPDAPAVDIAVTGGPVLFANTSFGNAYPYQEVAAATYNLEVRAAGTMNVVLRVPNVVVQAGQVVSIYAQGLAMGTGAQALRAVIYVDNAPMGAGGAASAVTGGSAVAGSAIAGSAVAGSAIAGGSAVAAVTATRVPSAVAPVATGTGGGIASAAVATVAATATRPASVVAPVVVAPVAPTAVATVAAPTAAATVAATATRPASVVAPTVAPVATGTGGGAAVVVVPTATRAATVAPATATRAASAVATGVGGGTTVMVPQTGRPGEASGNTALPVALLLGAATMMAGVWLRRRAA